MGSGGAMSERACTACGVVEVRLKAARVATRDLVLRLELCGACARDLVGKLHRWLGPAGSKRAMALSLRSAVQ